MAQGTKKRRAAKVAPTSCFLCRNPIAPEDLKEAFERLRDETIPSSVEYAHEECADEAGLWEEDEDDAEELDRPARG